MLQRFDVHIPLQKSYQRQLAFSLGVRDAMTQRLITSGLDIWADNGVAPRMNASGWYIWMKGAEPKPTVIKIKALALGLEDFTVNVSAATTTDEVELSPLQSYPFPSGATVYRSRLIDGATSVAGAMVQLELRVQQLIGSIWQASGPVSKTNKDGEFAAIFRPPPPQIGDEGAPAKVSVRLRVERRFAGNPQPSRRLGTEFQLPVGITTTSGQSLDWPLLTQL
jgi:hypothetical protein